ncbi:MAG: DUF481 domain-containing protein [Proteobacteria bacterium]|nr:DUF481 domain-containing protein [Pseudomonadota bacterium]
MNLPVKLIGIALFSIAGAAIADSIEMKNGDRISGLVEEISADSLRINPEYGDPIVVMLDAVAVINSAERFVVERADGTTVKGSIANTADGTLAVVDEAGQSVALISLPAPVEPDDYTWFVTSDLSANVSKGNTESEDWRWYTAGEVEYGAHLHKGDFAIDKQEANGVETKDQSYLTYNYNWNFNDAWFLTGGVAWEQDPIKDLQNRYRIGAGLGYYIFNTDDIFWSVGVTADGVFEEIGGVKDESLAPRWFLDYKQKVIDGRAEVFHRHSYATTVSGRDNDVFKSSTGFRFDLTAAIYAKIQIDYNNESEPAALAENDDFKYLIGVGVRIN